jgi:hypothetical protein
MPADSVAKRYGQEIAVNAPGREMNSHPLSGWNTSASERSVDAD